MTFRPVIINNGALPREKLSSNMFTTFQLLTPSQVTKSESSFITGIFILVRLLIVRPPSSDLALRAFSNTRSLPTQTVKPVPGTEMPVPELIKPSLMKLCTSHINTGHGTELHRQLATCSNMYAFVTLYPWDKGDLAKILNDKKIF